MNRSAPKRAWLEIRRLSANAVPLAVAQQLGVSLTAVDALVAGQLGATALSAGGAGGSMLFILQIFTIGMVAGLAPWLGRLLGEKRRKDIGIVFTQSLWFALFIGSVALGIAMALYVNLDLFGYADSVNVEIRNYLRYAMWCLPAAPFIVISRAWCEVSQNGKYFMLIQVVGAALNVVTNFGLGLGLWGLPRLGMAGIGLSTTLVQYSMMLAAVLLLRYRKGSLRPPGLAFLWPDLVVLKRLAIYSMPICLTLLFEVGMFIVFSLLATGLGIIDGAAHTIATQVSGFMFMLPLGFSMALSARTAIAFGKAYYPLLALRIKSGCLMAALCAMINISFLLVFYKHIPALFSQNTEVIALASQLLLFSVFFQLSDCLQITFTASLRGIGDTRLPSLIIGACFWLLGVGSGVLIQHVFALGAISYWIGLVIGLSTASIGLALRLAQQLKLLRTQPWPAPKD